MHGNSIGETCAWTSGINKHRIEQTLRVSFPFFRKKEGMRRSTHGHAHVLLAILFVVQEREKKVKESGVEVEGQLGSVSEEVEFTQKGWNRKSSAGFKLKW